MPLVTVVIYTHFLKMWKRIPSSTTAADGMANPGSLPVTLLSCRGRLIQALFFSLHWGKGHSASTFCCQVLSLEQWTKKRNPQMSHSWCWQWAPCLGDPQVRCRVSWVSRFWCFCDSTRPTRLTRELLPFWGPPQHTFQSKSRSTIQYYNWIKIACGMWHAS